MRNLARRWDLRLAIAAIVPVMATAYPTSAAESQTRYDLTIAATTDVPGRLRGWDYYANAADSSRSLAAAATIVDSLRRANPGRVVLLDAGSASSSSGPIA